MILDRITLPWFALGALLSVYAQFVSSDESWEIQSDGVTVGIAASDAWVTPRAIDLSSTPPVDQIQGGGYYRLVDNQLKVDADGTVESYQRLVITLVNQAGVDNNSQFNIDFDPTYQNLVLHSLDVIRGGHRVDHRKIARLKLLSRETELDQKLYSGAITLNILLEGVLPGDTVEYSYSLNGFNPVYQGIFAYSRTIDFGVPIQSQHVRVLWGKGSPLQVHVHNSDVAVNEIELGDYTAFELEAISNTFLKVASQTPPWYEPNSVVYFSEAGGWGDVVDWAEPMYRFGSTDSEIQEIAGNIAAANSGIEAQILAALSFVQTNIRYVGIEIGQNSHMPSPPLETLGLKYGDCKDKVALLLAILGALEIDAYPALVNTGVRKLIRDLPPSVNLFDHVIVWLEHNGASFWLDPTLSHQLGDFETIYQPDYGYALILRPGEHELRSMEREKHPDITWLKESYSVPEPLESPVSFQVETVYTGYAAMSMQWRIEESGLSNIADEYEIYYQQFFPTLASAGELEARVDEGAGTFSVVEKYTITEFWSDGGEHWEVGFDPSDIQSALLLPDQTQRDDPLSLSYPNHLKMTLEVVFEEKGWSFSRFEFVEDNDFFSFSQKARPTEDKLLVDYEFRAKTDFVPAERIQEYLDARERALENAGYSVQKFKDGSVGIDAGEYRVWLVIGLLLFGLFIFVIIDWRLEARQRPAFEKAVFFPVATWKFVLLSTLSFGFYSSYWMYRNWKYVRDARDKPVMPIIRGIFSYIWVYPLFLQLKSDSEEEYSANRVMAPWLAVFCTCAFAVTSFAAGVDAKSYWSLSSLIAPLVLLPFVRYINERNQQHAAALEFNSRWRLRHTAACIFLIPLLTGTVLLATPIVPTGRVVEQTSLLRRDLAYIYRQSVVPASEQILAFYSDAFINVRNDGNGFTANRVFSYWRDGDDFYLEAAEFKQVKDIDVTWSKNPLENSVVTVFREDDSTFTLFVTAENGDDKAFVEALKEAWKHSKLD